MSPPPKANVVRLPTAASLSWDDCRLLVESVVDYAIFMLDPAGHVSTWNPGAVRVKGYAPEEIVGRHFEAFYTAEDRAAGKPARLLETARTEGRVEDEGWRVRKDGSRFWANVVITALRDDAGDFRGFAKVTRDLTARHEAQELERRLLREQAEREAARKNEALLQASEQRHRALSQRLEIVLEGVADGITVQDRTGRVVYANRAAARVCGFDTPEALVAATPEEVRARFDILDEDGRPFPLAALPSRRVFTGEATAAAILRVRERVTGKEWWSSVRATAVLGDGGEPELSVNIWHDVTTERRADRQARYLADATAVLGGSLELDAMLAALARVLVPGLADWCVLHGLDGGELELVGVAHVDPAKVATAEAYERSFPPDRTQPHGLWNVVRSGQPELYNEISDAMLVASTDDPVKLEALRAAGMTAVLLAPLRARDRVLGTLSLVSAESGRRYAPDDVALVEELGRRAGVAMENAQLYAAAQAAAKVADEASRAKDEFLATVSHELRTPLNAILGWASLLKERPVDAALAKPLEVIHRNALAQVRIIDDILDVSRVITGKLRIDPRPMDVVAIARDALDVVRPSAEARRITLAFAPGEHVPQLVADPERLQQVVWNLLSNAVKFTDPGGHVELALAHDDAHVTVRVTDSGRGIAPAFLPYVFDRFKQADSTSTRAFGGLGLGLAIVRHIVELHGGHVAAASPGLGRGATFTIVLPCRPPLARVPDAPPSRPQLGARPSTDGRLDGVRVLVVDDEPDARDLVETVLGAAGAVVECAASAAEGLASLRRLPPDVLVSDLGMPGQDGFGLLRLVRALAESEGGRVPALALTAFAREEDRAKALGAGFTAHLAKPVDPAALVAAVQALAPRRSR